MLARNPLFDGLEPDELGELAWLMRPRRFGPGESICVAGETGTSLFLIADGLAGVVRSEGDEARVVARLRRGDVIGEMSLMTGEPRSATVVATTETNALELDQKDFAALIARHPRILENVSKILSRRLAETTARSSRERSRGEAVGLLVGAAGARLVPDIMRATGAASPRPVASVDARLALEAALGPLDDLLGENGTVVLVASTDTRTLPAVADSVDRLVALALDEAELAELASALDGTAGGGRQIELVIAADSARASKRMQKAVPANASLLRVLGPGMPPPAADLAWLGRHLSGTKLGLALGAGGAKGYAHVGALQVLEEAGYTVDCVAGSSIGAIVAAFLALGMSSAEIDLALRDAFRPEVVSELFKLSLSGASTGLETMAQILREKTGEQDFEATLIPLVVMTVDLNARSPAPVTAGPLWEALLAATAVAGLFPPFERDGQRLVDGLALVPVPVDAAVSAGADVTVSVNLLSRDTLLAWPGAQPPPSEPPGGRVRILDTLLEVMDVSQLDSSERHAARADVPITPRFGPGNWRDFQLADLFLAAGRQAAEEQLPALRSLATPVNPNR
jgi:predicted acylesterase/phospholipase RssA/CRP-like cAMP-binding protein